MLVKFCKLIMGQADLPEVLSRSQVRGTKITVELSRREGALFNELIADEGYPLAVGRPRR